MSPLGVSPTLLCALMAGLGCWSFSSSKWASKGVLLIEGTTLVPSSADLHAVDRQAWQRGRSAEEVRTEKEGFSMEASLAN